MPVVMMPAFQSGRLGWGPQVLKLVLVVTACWLAAQAGCSRSSNPNPAQSSGTSADRVLSADAAAELAAKLANDQCERQFRKRPFTADRHSVVLEEGIYRWGELDVGGQGGFSALVTFRRDGSEPHVEVYFSTDAQRPKLIQTEPLQPKRP